MHSLVIDVQEIKKGNQLTHGSPGKWLLKRCVCAHSTFAENKPSHTLFGSGREIVKQRSLFCSCWYYADCTAVFH